jgi:UDP-glucose 4-epimerase
MAEYFVTGGCGFIGSHLCEALLQRGDRVRVLDDLSTGSRTNLPSGVAFIEADIRDAAAVRAALAGCDGCFHLAAIASVERSRLDWIESHSVNLSATIQLFDIARRSGPGGHPVPVVYASSAAVYGDQGKAAASEAALPAPVSAYGADKLGGEHHARVAALVHGVPTLGLRFFNVYGPGQPQGSPYSGVISIFCDRLANGLPLTIFGDGEQTRDFLYVADAVSALTAAMERIAPEPDVLNVCTGRSTSVLKLAGMLAGLFGRDLRLAHEPARQGEIRHSLGDPSRVRERLGFAAATPIERGLALTVEAIVPAAGPDRRSG